MLQSSFAEIARLLSEFFRDLDVVPSDVLAGLILLRQRQQAARQHIISQVKNIALLEGDFGAKEHQILTSRHILSPMPFVISSA